jgi:hypothetical protein
VRDLHDGPHDDLKERLGAPWDFSPTLAALALANRDFAVLAQPFLFEVRHTLHVLPVDLETIFSHLPC